MGIGCGVDMPPLPFHHPPSKYRIADKTLQLVVDEFSGIKASFFLHSMEWTMKEFDMANMNAENKCQNGSSSHTFTHTDTDTDTNGQQQRTHNKFIDLNIAIINRSPKRNFHCKLNQKCYTFSLFPDYFHYEYNRN